MNWKEILKPARKYQENKEYQENQNQNKPNIPDFPYILGGEENKNEIIEDAKYLFFERLGISDNEELALDETINYIINQKTIH